MINKWDYISIDKACNIRPPKSEVKNYLSNDDEVSFVTMRELQSNNIDLKASKNRKLSEVYSSYTYFRNNDVLLAKITPCFENGKLGVASGLKNGIGFGSSEFIVYRPNKNLISSFLYYFLNRSSLREAGEKLMIGAVGHKRIPKSFYEKVMIPIPPLSEQKQIVETLDKAFEKIDKAIANVERNIENAEELFKSKLDQIFSQVGESWEENKLVEITTKIGSGATPRGGKSSYKQTGISLIRSMNVYDYGFKQKDLAFIDDDQAAKLNNVIVEQEDILLNITGASVARCCIVPKEYLPARVNQHVSIIRLNDKVIPSFVHYFLISNHNKKLLLGIGEKGGSTRQAITKSDIESFIISYPSDKQKQKEIVDSLNTIRNHVLSITSYYNKELEDLKELKKSILEKAFKGELTNAA